MPFEGGQIVHQRYQILSLLGQGGMGAVYRAYDQQEGRPCAVKEMQLSPDLPAARLEGLRDQFRREAAVLSSLKHPGLVKVIGYFVERETEYLVMEFVQGQNLEEILKQSGKPGLPQSQVLAWASQMLDTLEYIHTRNVIHRDIKPANIRLALDGRVVLVDFGLVKVWDPRNPATFMAMRGAGTPQFAPPEQLDDTFGHTDARSDLYSLGATLYALLAGRFPPRVTDRIIKNTPVPSIRSFVPEVSPRVDEAILKSMQLNRMERFQSAVEMRQALVPQANAPAERAPSPPRGVMPPAPSRAPSSSAPPVPSRVAPPGSSSAPSRITPPEPPPPPRPRRRPPAWVWTAIILVMISLVCFALAIGVYWFTKP